MIGAKKLTWKTCCQSSKEVGGGAEPLPFGPFGEMPALLTSALQLAALGASRFLISAMPRIVSSGSARSTWM